MKTKGKMDVWTYVACTSALVASEWAGSRSDRFNPCERDLNTHWTGGCVGSRTVLGVLERRYILILLGLEP
jgi:hypothetical protein